MASALFKKLLKATKNEYAAAAEDGNDADVVAYVDTGSYTLNALLSGDIYGGLPLNKVTALAGSPSTGKTFIALDIIKNFLKTNPKGAAFYFESESAVTTAMLEERGIDLKRFFMVPVSTIEEFRTQCVCIIDEYLKTPKEDREPMIMALDSLGMLSTSKEVKEISAGGNDEKKDMTKPGLVKGAFRVITLKAGRANVPILVTNHLYSTITPYSPPKVMGGGEGLPYAASTILYLDKKKKKDSDKNVVGVIISATNTKARLTVENKRVETLLDFQTGLNRYYGLLDIADKGGLIDKDSTYVFCGIKTPFKKDADFENGVYENPEKYFTKDVLEKINEVVKREFKYGSSIANNSTKNE
jgi:RecA/RadA recombinase